ncbi:hypothetical protein [Nocardioides sp.]|uniref:hypothetical protein n=1 Tax=Nocardioides sp. TaxID=35761 RepID=UPI002ED3F4D4
MSQVTGPDTGGSVVEPAATYPASRGRAAAAIICLVLAGLLTVPAAIGYWGQRTLNDTQRYVETVGPLIESPEVQDALSATVTDAIQQQVDIEALLNEAFAGVIDDAPRLELLVGPLSAAINGAVERQVREFFASDTFADIWTRVNTRAQQALQRILQGDETRAISLQGEEVVLDVSEVIDEVKVRLVDRGLTFVENAPIPESDRQIVLLDAPRLAQMRTIYAFGNPVARWMLPIVGLLYAGAFVLARRKPRMIVAIGAVIAANALLLALALSVGRQLFSNELSGTTFGPASRAFYETLLAYLQRGQVVVLWLGLVLVVAGWFAGANQYGTAVRTTVTGGLERLGAVLPGDHVGAGGRWVAGNVRWLRIAAVALGAVILLWGNDVSVARWWWSLALVLFLLAVLQVLVGAGRASAPHEARPTSPTVPA